VRIAQFLYLNSNQKLPSSAAPVCVGTTLKMVLADVFKISGAILQETLTNELVARLSRENQKVFHKMVEIWRTAHRRTGHPENFPEIVAAFICFKTTRSFAKMYGYDRHTYQNAVEAFRRVFRQTFQSVMNSANRLLGKEQKAIQVQCH